MGSLVRSATRWACGARVDDSVSFRDTVEVVAVVAIARVVRIGSKNELFSG
jgi:hypothetical protein